MVEVSIITINKNNAQGLENTIISVLNQDFKNYEYIVIDGRSTDNSIDVIKKYEDSIDYWVSEVDDGVYDAMNKGIAKASGRYIIFMNSGDCFYSNDILSEIFGRNPDKDFIVGTAVTKGKWVNQRSYLPQKIDFFELATYPVCHQAMFTKRSLFEELGYYDEQMKISADWKFLFLAVMLYNKKIGIIDKDIAWTEPNGMSASAEFSEIMRKERYDTIKEYFPYIYDDYLRAYQKKRISYKHLKLYIIWRLRRLLIS
ncbi:MAG: glycosyltransferase family 2 protein [Dysgonomonas sp.]|nr:glycosyltransferase family 2 protein [Dysgonomonas sp.]